MRGIHRSRGWHRKPGARFELVVLVVALALVISQSLGMIAASALDSGSFNAWGWHSQAPSTSKGSEKTSTASSVDASAPTRDRSSGGASVTALAPIEVPSGSTDLEGLRGDGVTWTDGNLCAAVPKGSCYKELDQVPHRINFTGLTNGQEYYIDVLIEFKDNLNHTGYDQLTGPTSVTGSISGAAFVQQADQDCGGKTCKTFRLSFTATGSSGVVQFNVRLGIGAHLWNGSNLSVELGNGNETVPLPVNEIVFDIIAHKFNDLNSNGTQDGGEPDLPGWTMTLYKGPGCSQQITLTGNPGTTNANGNVTWTVTGGDADNNGDFSVGETLQAGWTNTTPLCQTTQGQQVNFGNHQEQPTLTITKAASSSQVTAGAAFSYTITVKNTGNAQATGVVVTDNLADSLTGVTAGFDIDPGSAGGTGSCTVGAGNTISCAVGTLAANDGSANGPDEVVVTINATAPNTCGQLENTASVDSNETSPQSSGDATIVTVTGCAPTLTITKQALNANGGPITTIPLGGSFNYVITVINTGNASASPVIVTDNLNDSLTVNSTSWDVDPPDASTDGTCTVAAGNTVSCPDSGTITLAASDGAANGNDTLQVVINVTVPENLTSCPTLTNSAQVRIGIAGSPSDAQSAPVDVTGCASNLTITKQGPATVGQGGVISYTITVKNTGNAQATGVIVTDDLADSLTGVAGSFDVDPGSAGGTGTCTVTAGNNVSCSVGTLAANDGGANGPDEVVVTITANAPVGQCPTITNQASFVTEGGEGQTGTSNTVTTTVTGCVAPPPPSAGINVVKGGPVVAHVGDTITYTFAVSLAAGSVSLTNITVTDPICSATPTLGTKTGGDQDTTLETGETWNFSCTHVVTASDPDPLPNTVTATGIGPNGQVSDTDTHSVDIIHPAIQIVKTARPTSIGPGETVTYTFKVTNTGDVTLFDVKVTDNKLGDICTIAQLDVGETETCTADFTASTDFGGPLDNVGKAKGHDVTGFSVEDTDRASIDVVLGTTVTPVTPPSGVAFTGASGVVTMAALALLLLLLGTGTLFLTRRREDGTEA